jgi:hypothetical protein
MASTELVLAPAAKEVGLYELQARKQRYRVLAVFLLRPFRERIHSERPLHYNIIK